MSMIFVSAAHENVWPCHPRFAVSVLTIVETAEGEDISRGIHPASETMNVKKNFTSETFSCDFSPQKMSFHLPKFLMTFSLVINSRFLNFTSNFTFLPFFFSKYVHFPLKTSPNISCTKISFRLKCNKHFFTSKMGKNYFPLKMALMKISASFPSGMDAPGYLNTNLSPAGDL